MTSKCGLMALLLSLVLNTGEAAADSREPSMKSRVHDMAESWLKANTAYVSCDEKHFIYGVGYIDGSYMERIFYVSSDRNTPVLSVRFRESGTSVISSEVQFDPLPFVLEIKVPAARAAVPANGSWRLTTDGWESALRFKYTSWYGTIGRQNGQWDVNWEGYRRPMLPRTVTERVSETCNLFPAR